MKKIWPMLAFGFGMYVLFALLTLPAHLITDRLASQGVTMVGVQGTVWSGNAQAVQISSINLGSLRWSLRPLALFMAQASADVAVKRDEGSLDCRVFYGLPNGPIKLGKLTASLPLNSLPPTLTQGWQGMLQANFSELVVSKALSVSAKGYVQALNLVGPPRQPNNIGSFKVSFPAAKPVKDMLAGDLSTLDGPLRVTATLQLKPPTPSYFIEGKIATEAGAPPEIARALPFLGDPDSQGNRPFSLAGTF